MFSIVFYYGLWMLVCNRNQKTRLVSPGECTDRIQDTPTWSSYLMRIIAKIFAKYAAILQSLSLHFSAASIAGVTYMDHFDFEQRYRDVNECNPFYWHPLHLPEECVQMFEKLIRSGLGYVAPYRIVKDREGQDASMYSSYYLNTPDYSTEFVEPLRGVQTLSPFEILFELLRRDVQDLPSAPTLGISPYLGPMALYRQPVSYKSVAMIKKLSKAYANSGYTEYGNTDRNNIVQKKKKKIKFNKKRKNGTIITEGVVKNNDILTLLKIKEFK